MHISLPTNTDSCISFGCL